MTERTFTTFEAGKILGVFHTSVIRWVNEGKIKATVTPGGHRRIALSGLLDFMRRFELPIPEGLGERPKRVMIVEDDPSVLRLLERSLDTLPGVKVELCTSGLDALISIGKEAPDLLILDIRVPQVNGVEVCQVLKSNDQTRPIKIIAVTGEPMSPEQEAYLNQHADGFFEKPIPIEPLRQLARRLLEVEDVPAAPAPVPTTPTTPAP